MNITIKAAKYTLTPESEALIKEKLSAPVRLLGEEGNDALLEIEIEHAPAEGRSAEPCRVVARLIVQGKMFHAEAVKPTPESAADRVRSELEAEIRRYRGRARRLVREGSSRLKRMLRFGRQNS
jgi:ribosome-associated translation inhibitor RaiA